MGYVFLFIVLGVFVLFLYLYIQGFFLLILKRNPLDAFKYKKFKITFLGILLLFIILSTISAIELALYCGVQKRVLNDQQYFYMHRKSIWFPSCSNVGVHVWGEVPAGFLKINTSFYYENIIGVGPYSDGNAYEKDKLIPYYLVVYLVLLSIIPAFVLTDLIINTFKLKNP